MSFPHFKPPPLSVKHPLLLCFLRGDGAHIDSFYDSQWRIHRAVLMFERSSCGSRQVAQMGFDGRVPGLTLLWVRRGPLSHLYCPVQTPWGLTSDREDKTKGHFIIAVKEISKYQREDACGNSDLIHWLNQSGANMRLPSEYKKEWFERAHRCRGVIS